MKITPTLRALLVAMCLCMVFSLFACTEEVTTLTDSPATDAPTEEKTEAPTQEKTEAPTSEKTEAPTDEPTETEEPTEAPCAHEEVVLEGKAATCTEAGLTEGKKCAKCEEILVPQEEIPATGHTEETLAAVAPTCQATGLTEGKKCSVCEAVLTAQETVAIDPNAHNMDNGTPAEAAKCGDKATVTYKCQNEGCTHTNVVEGEELAHDMDEGTVTTAPTCTEKGVKTFKCKREGCDHETTDEVAALGHTEETVAGKAATCTATGLTDGKKCSVCGVTTVEQNEIPVVAHTEATLDAVAPTCTATGLTEGKKCSVCETVIKAQETVDALGHAKKDVGYIAPTTADFGYVPHKGCERCDAVWTTEDEATTLEALAIAKIVPTTNKYFGFAELTSGDHPFSRAAYAEITPSADRTYVRYARKAKFNDGNIQFIFSENEDVTGQYLVFKYRTDKTTAVAVWGNMTGEVIGAANAGYSTIPDEQWHIAVVDLSALLSKFVTPNEQNEYVIKWSRIDILDNEASEGYFDLAYVAYTDDLAKIAPVLQDGDQKACAHSVGSKLLVTAAFNEETYKYEGTCAICGDFSEYFLHKREANCANGNLMTASKGTDADGTTYVRYTNSASGDAYAFPYLGGVTGSGRYMVMRIRATGTSETISLGPCYGVSVASGVTTNFASGDGMGTIAYLKTDGNWQYVIIDIKGTTASRMTADGDGNIDLNCIRISFTQQNIGTAEAPECNYIDIDYIAFAKDVRALNELAQVESGVCQHHTYDCTLTASENINNQIMDCGRCGAKVEVSNITSDGHMIITPDQFNITKSEASAKDTVVDRTQPFLKSEVVKDEESGLSYVHISFLQATNQESYMYLQEKRTNVGRYVAVIYRSANVNAGEVFICGAGAGTALGNCTTTWSKDASDWTLAVFDFSNDADCGWDENRPITAWRWDINNGITDPASSSLDIAAVAFFDSAEAAQAYYASFAALYCN